MPPIFVPSDAARILVAPDAFKGTFTAADAAAMIAADLARAVPAATIDLLPLADGGDGTVAALAAGAGYAVQPVITRGPTGIPTVAVVGRRGPTVVVELASACGITLLPAGRLAPLRSSTLGLGDAVTAALTTFPADPRRAELVLALGGSASTDGGAGLLTALGARLLDAAGRPVPPGGARLAEITEVDLTFLDPRLARYRVTVATDVRSPLLGPTGAALAFAPQKGADPAQAAALDRALASWSSALAAATGVDAAAVPGAGAAGGTGLAAIAALGARVVPGARFVHEAVGLRRRIAAADLVITGEGCLDATSLLGKGIGAVAEVARAERTPIIAVCGRVDLSPGDVARAGFADAVDLVTFRARLAGS